MTTTFDGIRAIIVRDFDLSAERLQRDTLLEEIELDSLSITELVFSIEDEFKVTAESTIPPFKTLGDIADYVARLIAERDTKPRVAAKAAAAAPSRATDVAAPAAIPRPSRSGAKKARSGAGAPESPKRQSGTQKANGKANKRANGEKGANGAGHVNGHADNGGRTKARAAKRPGRGAPNADARPRKPKSSGGRVGARAR
jgi:acyl carrier protein